jgi:hypothetical protein
MADKNIVIQRNNAGTIDNIYPQTQWGNVLNKPTTFTPTSHNHTLSDLPTNTLTGSTFPGAYSAPGGGSNQGVILFGDYYGWHTRSIGTTGQVLTVSGGVPTWATPLVSTTVTIASGDWSANSATKTVSGVTASSFLWVSPDAASYANFGIAEVRATAQGTNSITFTCTTTPSVSITVVVIRG